MHEVSNRVACHTLWLLAGLCSVGQPHAADAQCASGQTTASERMVCNQPQLARLEDRINLANAFVTANAPLTSEFERDQFQANHRTWQHRRDNCGADVPCLERSYRHRLRELLAWDASRDPRMPASGAMDNWLYPMFRGELVAKPRFGGSARIDFDYEVTKDAQVRFDASVWRDIGNGRRLSGVAALTGDGAAHYHGEDGCRLDFIPGDEGFMRIIQHGECGETKGNGSRLDFDGEYRNQDYIEQPFPDFSS